MKLKVFIIAALAVLGSIILLITLIGTGSGREIDFDAEKWSSMSADKQESNIEDVFKSRELPVGQEVKFLSWLMVTSPDMAERMVEEYGQGVEELPWFISDTALQLIKVRNLELGFKTLQLAQSNFPRNPDVLGVSGIVAYLSGNMEDARRLLEEAETWRQNKPIVNFYLGGLLITSQKTADMTRGKRILMELVTGEDAELSELSGLALLTSMQVPMNSLDYDTIYKSLDSSNTFRTGNPNLSAEALRIIINKLARLFPDQAMSLAELLSGMEDATLNDLLGTARLAQANGSTDVARKVIDSMASRANDPEALKEDQRYTRVMATQLFLEGNYESGLLLIESLVRGEQPEVEILQETFQTILRSIDSIDTERQLLRYYLELPVRNVQTSLDVLGRLIQIEPLQEEARIQYAIDELLDLDILRVGDWLTRSGASEQLIGHMSGNSQYKNADAALVLVNANLELGNGAGAQAALDGGQEVLEQVIVDYLQARIFSLTGEKEKAVEHWERAQQGVMGSNQFSVMKSLGFLALELDQPVNALQSLYMSLTAGIPFTQSQAGQLMQLTLSYGTLRQSIQVAKYLSDLNPGEAVHMNNLAYFNFLAEESVEESVEIMRNLVEAYEDIPQFKLTLALGLVKAGRKNEASRLLQNTDINWSEAGTRGLLIYVVVLAATDQKTLAQGLMQNLDQTELIPEERALLEEF
ncbi:MAG: hypothetical protein AB3N63_15655 [Puniceicoccaceae bacterium]